MLTREYLHQAGWTKDDLAEFLGHKTTQSVTKKMDVELPKRWARLLDAGEPAPSAVGNGDSVSDARAHTDSDPTIADESTLDDFFRDGDSPRKPDGADTVVGPQGIKLTTVEGYIEMVYGGAAAICKSRGDELAADVINRYSPQFSEAWINYIQSDPRIMAYLERLMIGTPLGNLIGVHAIAIGSYAFARAAARQIANAYDAEQSTNPNGAVDNSTGDFLA